MWKGTKLIKLYDTMDKTTHNKKNIFSRRSFLKGLGIGTAAVAAPATIVSCAKESAADGEQEPPVGKMTYRTQPTSGDKVSILGYGMMRLPTKNDHIGERQNGEGEIDQDMVNKQVDYALEHGLNLFDTSPVYCKGLSEKALGTALSRHDRKQYFISTKMSNMHEYSREASIAMFEKSLADLQTDHIDYYLWHNIGGDRPEEGLDAMGLFEARFINNGIMDFLNQKKKEGVIRNLGFSYHGDVAIFDHALKLHDQGKVKFDFVLIELNYLDWKHAKEINDYNTNAEYLYGEIEKRGLMAFVMEPLLGGWLSNLPDKLVAQLKRRDPDHSVASWAFRYAASHKNVLCVLSGMTYMEHLKDNLRTYCPLHPLTEAEMRFLDEDISKQIVGYNTIPCNDCKYCMPCPYGIDIPGIFVHYNKCLSAENVVKSTADPNYEKARRAFLVGYDRSVPKLRQADHCIGCGKCVSSCPQRIRIPDELHRISEYVEAIKQHHDATE